MKNLFIYKNLTDLIIILILLISSTKNINFYFIIPIFILYILLDYLFSKKFISKFLDNKTYKLIKNIKTLNIFLIFILNFLKIYIKDDYVFYALLLIFIILISSINNIILIKFIIKNKNRKK